MPNIKSQKDRVVQAQKEALHNKAIKSNLKTVVNQFKIHRPDSPAVLFHSCGAGGTTAPSRIRQGERP